MYFPKLQLTDAGKATIIKALAGGTIKFTGMKLGAGPEPEFPEKMTALGDERASAQLESMEQGEGCVELVANFDNSALQEGFEARELGIIAEDPDDGEILYAYANAGEKATFMPSFETNSFIRTLFRVEVAVGDAENVTAVIGEYLGWASKEDFDAHVKDENNPHKVTKKQLGLENVQNVSPSNMQVAFSERIEGNEELVNIKTNEKLTDVFRKILLVFDSFFKHLKATNPHKVTASQVGIAQSNLINTYTHTYDASTKTHKFTGSGSNGIAKITADFTAGDRFAVNGVTVSAYCGKDSPDANTIIKGRWVSFVFDGTQLNFKGGGGLGYSDLGEATAGTGDVLYPKTYFSGEGGKNLRTGSIQSKAAESVTLSATKSSHTFDTTCKYCTGNMTVSATTKDAETKTINAALTEQSYTFATAGKLCKGDMKVTVPALASKDGESVTITPGTSAQSKTFATTGKYCTGDMTVNVPAEASFIPSSTFSGTISGGVKAILNNSSEWARAISEGNESSSLTIPKGPYTKYTVNTLSGVTLNTGAGVGGPYDLTGDLTISGSWSGGTTTDMQHYGSYHTNWDTYSHSYSITLHF